MRYANATIETVDEEIRKTIRNRKVEREGHPNSLSRGICIFGITGSGKTYSLYAIKNVLISWGLKKEISNVENWVELLFELKEKFSSNYGIKDTLYEITKNRYVFIDDIGAEKQTEWSQEMMYLIFNRVYQKEGILFMTSNLTVDEFTNRYGDRIASRLAEMCDIKELPQEDKRLK